MTTMMTTKRTRPDHEAKENGQEVEHTIGDKDNDPLIMPFLTAIETAANQQYDFAIHFYRMCTAPTQPVDENQEKKGQPFPLYERHGNPLMITFGMRCLQGMTQITHSLTRSLADKLQHNDHPQATRGKQMEEIAEHLAGMVYLTLTNSMTRSPTHQGSIPEEEIDLQELFNPDDVANVPDRVLNFMRLRYG